MGVPMAIRIYRRSSMWKPLLAVTSLLGVLCIFTNASAGSSGVTTTTSTTAWVAPNKVNEVDCNGWSSAYKAAKPAMRGLCTDPIQIKNGKAARFIDNGWYVGHDEPSVKFISKVPGSGNTMTYDMQVPVDPTAKPTVSGSVTDYGELSIAPWFGLPMCDPLSYPQNTCTPDSDSNIGSISSPNAAGSAFMELQLYPPGFGPFTDSFSCSQTQWCAAMTIDSLECNFGFSTCNPRCEEPVNFSYLQTNGVPSGPPSPQLSDLDTEIGNANTLKINPGDVLEISITDPSSGFTTGIRDLTTGQTGYMTASAANGFMDTNMTTCDGRKWTFHAEYSTASKRNQVPWAALEGGVLMEQELGHFETCNALAYQDGFSATYPAARPLRTPTSIRPVSVARKVETRLGLVPATPIPTYVTTLRPRVRRDQSHARPRMRAPGSFASSQAGTASRRAIGRCCSTGWPPHGTGRWRDAMTISIKTATWTSTESRIRPIPGPTAVPTTRPRSAISDHSWPMASRIPPSSSKRI